MFYFFYHTKLLEYLALVCFGGCHGSLRPLRAARCVGEQWAFRAACNYLEDSIGAVLVSWCHLALYCIIMHTNAVDHANAANALSEYLRRINFSATRQNNGMKWQHKLRGSLRRYELAKYTLLEKSCFLEARNSLSLVRRTIPAQQCIVFFTYVIMFIFPCTTQKRRIPNEFTHKSTWKIMDA